MRAKIRQKAPGGSSILAQAAIVGSVSAGTAIGLTVFLLQGVPPLLLQDLTALPASTVVLARDGSPLGRFAPNGDRRPLSSLQEAGVYLPEALIAAEDKDFYRHKGVDPVAMIRSAWLNLVRGRVVSGASTITQQTVKLALFPQQERTWRRKLQEIVLALELEKLQTKEQILIEYMNALYFGNLRGIPVYGAESAARHAFGRPARSLTVAQSAFLAAIPNNPAYFSPFHRPERVLARQRWILRRMRILGMVTEPQYEQALREPVARELDRSPVFLAPYESRAPFVMSEVARTVPHLFARALGIPDAQARRELERGGYRICTTIDQRLQDRLDRAVKASDFPPPVSYTAAVERGQRKMRNAEEEVGAAILDNQTGDVAALCGGRDFARSQFDRAAMRRQPGSSLKPLVVYGPALDAGLVTSSSILDDLPRRYPDPSAKDGQWFPQNWDHSFHGLMTVQDALIQSFNGPAIELYERLGPRTGAQFAAKLGLDGLLPEDGRSLGLAIGGTAGGVSPIELAAAYTALPRGGIFISPTLIARIESRSGSVVYRAKRTSVRVFTRGTAYLLTDMLRRVLDSPLGTGHAVLGAMARRGDVAGKTGTTDDNRDAWFVGFTPRHTMSAWVGYDIPHSLEGVGPHWETARPQRLFRAVMGPLLEREGMFVRPPGIRMVEVCSKSGDIPGPLCRAAGKVEKVAVVSGTEPYRICSGHILVLTARVGNRRVLATELTPLAEIQSEIRFVRDKPSLGPSDRALAPRDLAETPPWEPDPRGGTPLTPVRPERRAAPSSRGRAEKAPAPWQPPSASAAPSVSATRPR